MDILIAKIEWISKKIKHKWQIIKIIYQMGNKQEQKQNRTKLKKKEIMFSLPFNFNSVRIFISFSFFVMLTVCFFLCVLFHHSYSLALDCYCVVVAAVTVFQVLRSADFPISFYFTLLSRHFWADFGCNHLCASPRFVCCSSYLSFSIPIHSRLDFALFILWRLFERSNCVQWRRKWDLLEWFVLIASKMLTFFFPFVWRILIQLSSHFSTTQSAVRQQQQHQHQQ